MEKTANAQPLKGLKLSGARPVLIGQERPSPPKTNSTALVYSC
ncbi:hypothetical protein Sez_1475 [Streptococcus equi subsp. zooepidemicus MGCS10565]|uniref:Uncharacterized protein n=2 Tax=Streptococcus equi TaxID=1336 RepID=A0A922NVG1_9STRE|nr:hypothetical protein Sez_1475 [Streptococcus equi subsp. zooepidemicus MGCS10565]KED04955.1 hypothetical protein CECT5772_02663 [Streptococcus equi subsp. ruminatorum CECT 5772]